jgi:very-short-patch-repair endonuclease
MKRKIIPYNPKLKELARKLRNNSTKSEIKLWQQLKGKQLLGYDFHRQKPLLNYIADFYCYELKLVIEVDGYSHQFEETIKKDEIKQRELEKIGLTVLRFEDDEVMKDMNNVLRRLEEYVTVFEKHTPNPSQEGE